MYMFKLLIRQVIAVLEFLQCTIKRYCTAVSLDQVSVQYNISSDVILLYQKSEPVVSKLLQYQFCLAVTLNHLSEKFANCLSFCHCLSLSYASIYQKREKGGVITKPCLVITN